jgi:hypothetical protein
VSQFTKMNGEELKHRISNVIIILLDGNSFKIGDLSFNSKDNKHILRAGVDTLQRNTKFDKTKSIQKTWRVKSTFRKNACCRN